MLSPVGPYIGVEIGELASWVAVAWGREKPERQRRTRFPSPPDPDTFLTRLTDMVREVCGEETAIAGIGVSSWAPVDNERGGIEPMPGSPAWRDVSIITRLRESFGAPAVMRAAVDAAAFAEVVHGAGRGASPVVYVHLGREVLTSLVYDGAPVLGAHGRAGQIGHWQVAEDGPRCACGAIGHINPLCSSQGLVRLAIGQAAKDDEALEAVNAATGGRAESLTASRVLALAGAGVAPLRALVMDSANALGVALAQLTLIVNPEIIVLGGPLGVAGGLFIERTRERLADELRTIPSAGEPPQVAQGTQGASASLTGAWLLGREAAYVRMRMAR